MPPATRLRSATKLNIETFTRISALQEISDRRSSNIRFLCSWYIRNYTIQRQDINATLDADAEYQSVDKDGNEIPQPLSDPVMMRTKYYNRNEYVKPLNTLYYNKT
jgi:hypothetical protein